MGALPGPAYTAAKHGLVALSPSLNLEACRDSVRSCVIEPGEVDLPILDRRPLPLSAEGRARTLKPEHVAQAILFVATRPAHVCINEILLSPTTNRCYLVEAEAAAQA